MNKYIEDIIKGESGKSYRNIPCLHGGIMWYTDEDGWSHLKTPTGQDALATGLVKEIKGSTCQQYFTCTYCGLLLSEPERRTPGSITRPPQGYILEKN